MLRSFSVTNFKNFEKTTTFQLDSPSNYEFNPEVVQNGCISKAIVYGINGSGKSNLALALFDIILHLTDKERMLDKYYPYLNLNSKKPNAEFEYRFTFDGIDLIYRYGKTDPLTLTYENLLINGEEVLSFNFATKDGYTNLKGAESLQMASKMPSESDKLSRVKYVKSNAMLEDTEINRAFMAFNEFVDNMLMFYSLSEKRYQGLIVGVDSFTQGIIREGKLKEFEEFLRSQGIDYELVTVSINGQQEIFCKFNNETVPFTSVASTGTNSLGLFYYWYLKMRKASFVYIDEFDAFYHFELARDIVLMLREMTETQVVISSHNTDLISNDLLRPDAYFQIENNKIRAFDKVTEKELRRAHNIQKMYKAGSFNE